MTAAITTRYWDYPFEDCMIRETRTGDRLEVAVKFYGKDESIVEPTHEFYLDVWRGQGTAITADQYEAGKEKPERKVYTPRPPARYWDYPFEDCMIRETRTTEGLDIAIKFYEKDEWIVDMRHRLYRDVLMGGGTTITADQYEAGKETPERKVYTPRPPARYWDYPQEQCMIRETHTGTGLDIGIKFYGQRQQRVDETHDLYQQVLHGAGTNISATQYGEGKPQSDGADAT